MVHPSFVELLSWVAAAGPEDVGLHVTACGSCRALAEAARPPGAEATTSPTDEVYGERREIGAGGMGRTFRAVDRRLARIVAIKELRRREEFDDPTYYQLVRARFEREARIAARLQHPALVPVYESGYWPDGEPYYTMQYVEGASLEHEIARRPRLEDRLALLPAFLAVADAAGYAHAQGIVHRDITPANILIGKFGASFLIDWGLAASVDDPPEPEAAEAPRGGLTQLGAGTPQYMAPEQARGLAADRRMDVYALGATLYHLLAGAPPYGRDHVRARVLAEAPRSIAALAPELPSALATVVGVCMARDPQARFANAAEVADELRRFLGGQLTRSHRHSAGEIVTNFLRRHRLVVRVAGAALVLLIAGGVLAVTRILRARDAEVTARRAAENSLTIAQGSIASAIAHDPDRRLEAMSLAANAATGYLARGAEVPDEVASGLWTAVTAGPAAKPLPSPPGALARAHYSDDGRIIVSSRLSGAVQIFDARDGTPLPGPTSTNRQMVGTETSPRSAYVAIRGTDPFVELATLATGQLVPLPATSGDHPDEQVAGVAFSPDENLLLAVGNAGTVSIWETATGTRHARFDAGGALEGGLFRSDTEVALLGQDGALYLADADGHGLRRVPGHAGGIVDAALAPDGRLVTSGHDGRLIVWSDLSTVPRPQVLFELSYSLGLIAVSTRGRVVVTVSETEMALLDLPGTVPASRAAMITGWTEPVVGELRPFSPDGARLVLGSQDGVVRLYDAATGAGVELSRDAASAREPISNLRFSKDGDVVLDGHFDGTVRLVDAREGLVPRTWPGHRSELTAMLAGKDGLLVTASLDGEAHVLELASGATRATTASAGSELTCAARSTERFAIGGSDGQVRVYDLRGKPIATVAVKAPITSLALAPDGTLAAGALDGDVTIWDAASATRTLGRSALPVSAVAFSPDGDTLAGAWADGGAATWDRATWQRRELPKASPSLRSICFSPDGRTVAAGSMTGTTVLYRDGAPIAVLAGRAAEAGGCPFSPDGARLATVSSDGTVLIAGAGGVPGMRLAGHTRAVLAAAWNAAGTRLATASIDGTVRIWNPELPTAEAVLELPDITHLAWTPDGRWILAARGDGSLRLIPSSLRTAWDAACATLARLGDACRPPS